MATDATSGPHPSTAPDPDPRAAAPVAPPLVPAPAAAPGTAPAPAIPEADKPYTAVVYVHGMGQQRRFEEMSRLIDSLDSHANAVSRATPAPRVRGRFDPRWLTGVLPRLEPCRVGTDAHDDVGYVRLDCDPPDRTHTVGSLYRFYEVYWAPVAAGGTTVRSVVMWLAAQLLTPVRTMRSAWRERQRLRRSALHGLWRKPWLTKICHRQDGDLEKLTAAYDAFEGPEARRTYAAGTFRQFGAFLRERFAKRPDTAARLGRLARCWGGYYLLTEIGHLAVLLTLVLSVASLFALALYALWWAYDFVWNQDAMAMWRQGALGERLAPSLPNALAALGLLMSALGVTRFVTTYLGDVQFWCTYEETDEKHVKRAAILALATRQLEHVLDDPRCARVVVVAHSLGTAVAMDALLQLGRHNRARNNEDPMTGPLALGKIVGFITMGSPIDKIHYFFESYRSSYHRYIRVAEGVRGDITTVPFARNRKPHIHWVNFCDRGDVISGPLETPSGARLANLQVDNVQVSSFWFPDPGASHSGYFDHQQVIAHLYDIIFKGSADFGLARRPDPNAGRNYEAVLLGPGRARALVLVFQVLALMAPWLLAVAALLGPAGWAWRWAAVVTAAVLTAGWIAGRAKGHLAPIA